MNTNNSFVNIKLRREIVEGMISTYECLEWDNRTSGNSEGRKECKKIIQALKNSLKNNNGR